jgi:uncharacterized protein (DUF983 family)
MMERDCRAKTARSDDSGCPQCGHGYPLISASALSRHFAALWICAVHSVDTLAAAQQQFMVHKSRSSSRSFMFGQGALCPACGVGSLWLACMPGPVA